MIRLQKLLAAAGLGSRRSVEEWIRAGRITIGGRIAQLGDRASPEDEICLDGRKLELSPAQLSSRELLLYHKPVGEVTTRSDPQGRPTVFERLPEPGSGRWITVGRLDVNTSGLLLFTTDGELAHRLMHPSSEIEREYLVRVRGRPQPGILRQLLEGVELDDGTARFDRVTQEMSDGEASEGINTTFRVVLHEGRNREVRRLWQAVGLEVSRLLRVRYGPIELPRDLRPGATRVADANMTERLLAAAKRGGAAGQAMGVEQPAEQAAPRGEAVGLTPPARQRRDAVGPDPDRAPGRQRWAAAEPKSGTATQPHRSVEPKRAAATRSHEASGPKSGTARQSYWTVDPQSEAGRQPYRAIEPKSGAGTQPHRSVEPKSGAGTQPHRSVEPKSGAGTQPHRSVEPKSTPATRPPGAVQAKPSAERPWEAAARRRAAAERPGTGHPQRPKREPGPRK